MDLRSNNPYWLLRDGFRNTYPSLQKSQRADVTVIGGGITGALVTYHLCNAGFSVNVVDKRHIGFGSTAACTGLLQYEIDTPLCELIDEVGERKAVGSYQLSLAALFSIERIAYSLKKDIGYSPVPSLQFTTYKSHYKELCHEFNTRKKFGIADIEWLEETDLKKLFGLEKQGGILSQQGATIDAFAFTHELLSHSVKMGAVEVYDNTTVESIRHDAKKVIVTTADRHTLTSRWLVIACGYESQKYLSKQVEISSSTYAIASEPFVTEEFWHKNAMIWETADPYLYIRRTDSNRLIVGGKDDEFHNPEKRNRKLKEKSLSLQKSFSKLFPSINFRIDFSWAGYFGKTKDGLPYIGSVAERPNTYFALGFGGNGVLFSTIAAEIITDILSGKKNPNLSIFSFER